MSLTPVTVVVRPRLPPITVRSAAIIEGPAGPPGTPADSRVLKQAVLVATTEHILLAGLQTIDEVSVSQGVRVLVKDQNDDKENGIYLTAVGQWTRTEDFDGDDEVINGTLVFVTSGALNYRSFWYVANDNPIVIGTTELQFYKLPGFLELTALRDDAEAAALLAQMWAENPEDDPVITGQYSALHHAAKAHADRLLAQLAATAAAAGLPIYADTTAFIAGTVNGEYGYVQGTADGPIFATLYLNESEVATDTGLTLASYAAYEALAALIGPSDYPLDVRDPLGNLLAHVATSGEAGIGGMALKPGAGAAIEVQDPLGYVNVRLAALMSMINGWNFMADVPGMTEIHDLAGYIIARFDKAESMINGLTIRATGGEVEIQDLLGYILWRAGLETTVADDGGDGGSGDQPSSTVPLFGPYLYGVEDEITPLILDNVLTDRLDAPLCQATISPASGHPKAFEHSIDLDPATMGATATLVVRPRAWDGVQSSELPLTVRSCSNPVGGSPTPKILVLGDSIPTYQGPYLMDGFLDAWGINATWKGTTPTEGATPTVDGHFALDNNFMGECRPGIELADYTNLLTTSLDPVAIGGEATYLAAGTSTKRTFNPLIIVDDGVVADADLRNGYFIDFGAYNTRFSIGGIDILVVSLLTNDFNALNNDQVYARVFDEMGLLLRRWRAFDATKPMVIVMPGTGRSAARDAIWKANYSRGIRGLLALQADAADDNLHIIPTWAHVVNDTGYDLTAGASPDPVTGVIARTLADAVHPTGNTRRELWRVSAMGAAYALTHIV